MVSSEYKHRAYHGCVLGMRREAEYRLLDFVFKRLPISAHKLRDLWHAERANASWTISRTVSPILAPSLTPRNYSSVTASLSLAHRRTKRTIRLNRRTTIQGRLKCSTSCSWILSALHIFSLRLVARSRPWRQARCCDNSAFLTATQYFALFVPPLATRRRVLSFRSLSRVCSPRFQVALLQPHAHGYRLNICTSAASILVTVHAAAAACATSCLFRGRAVHAATQLHAIRWRHVVGFPRAAAGTACLRKHRRKRHSIVRRHTWEVSFSPQRGSRS